MTDIHAGFNNTPYAPSHGEVIARAQQLVDDRPVGRVDPRWVAEASHVGALSVLALALRG